MTAPERIEFPPFEKKYKFFEEYEDKYVEEDIRRATKLIKEQYGSLEFDIPFRNPRACGHSLFDAAADKFLLIISNPPKSPHTPKVKLGWPFYMWVPDSESPTLLTNYQMDWFYEAVRHGGETNEFTEHLLQYLDGSAHINTALWLVPGTREEKDGPTTSDFVNAIRVLP
jgi:hypothetical protein